MSKSDSIPLPIYFSKTIDPANDDNLTINAELLEIWLIAFIRDEIQRRRGFNRAIVGLSGGVDSSVTAYLCAKALGPENVFGIRMPYSASSSESLEHAQLVADDLKMNVSTIEITAAVDGYLQFEPDADGRRRGRQTGSSGRRAGSPPRAGRGRGSRAPAVRRRCRAPHTGRRSGR